MKAREKNKVWFLVGFFFEWQAGDAKIFEILMGTLSDALSVVRSRSD